MSPDLLCETRSAVVETLLIVLRSLQLGYVVLGVGRHHACRLRFHRIPNGASANYQDHYQAKQAPRHNRYGIRLYEANDVSILVEVFFEAGHIVEAIDHCRNDAACDCKHDEPQPTRKSRKDSLFD